MMMTIYGRFAVALGRSTYAVGPCAEPILPCLFLALRRALITTLGWVKPSQLFASSFHKAETYCLAVVPLQMGHRDDVK